MARPGTGVDDRSTHDATIYQDIYQTLMQPTSRGYASFLSDLAQDPASAPQSVSLVHTWLESIGPDRCCRRRRRRRSDCPTDRSVDELLAGKRPSSAPPEMGRTQESEGLRPPTPASSSSASRPTSADARESRSRSPASSAGVRHPLYRENNLQLNHIHFRLANSTLPDDVAAHLHGAVRARRGSPGLTTEQLNQIADRVNLLGGGCNESQVEGFLNDTAFPDPEMDPAYGPATGLMSTSGALMSQHLVPADPASPFSVSQPKPDRLYGYSGRQPNTRFTHAQLLGQTMLHPRIPDYATATMQGGGLRFPFFAIEIKAACGTGGNIWVAANQCAGASAACLNAVGRLNMLLQAYESTQRVDHWCYSLAVDNNIAQLYVSWKEDEMQFYLQQVGTFLLSSPEHFTEFRKQVRNILDWGKDTRLDEIRNALDIVLEHNSNTAAAKSRPAPSDDSTGRPARRRKL